MKVYDIQFTDKALKDYKKITPKLQEKLKQIVESSSQNPYLGKRLLADLKGFYSLRLSYQDRIVYTIDEKDKIIYIHRAKTHYGD